MKLSAAPSLFLLTLTVALGACDDSYDPYEPDDAEPSAEAEVPVAGVDALAAAAAPVAQMPGFDVEISLSGDDIVLDWADQGATQYEIWTSDYAYFSPMMTGSGMPVGMSTGTEFTLSGANSPTAPSNAYFIIVALTDDGSEVSTTVGRHGVTLYPGYNKIPLSLQTGLSDASDLFDAMSPYVDQVHSFDSTIQDWESWSPSSTDVPFSVQDGDTPVVEVGGEEPVYRAVTGYVPAPTDLASEPLLPGDNLVTLPLFYPDMPASVLAEMVPGLTAIGRWDPVSQGMVFGGPGFEEDLIIPSGGDMHLFAYEATSWPPSITMPTGPVSDEPSDCCTASSVSGCLDPAVESCVCAADAFCCGTAWDSLCVDQVESLSCGSC